VLGVSKASAVVYNFYESPAAKVLLAVRDGKPPQLGIVPVCQVSFVKWQEQQPVSEQKPDADIRNGDPENRRKQNQR